MRDDDIRSRLRESNPWWRATATGSDPTAWTGPDQVLKKRQPYDLGYRPDTLADVATGDIDDKLVILRGPRRVGKSVLLKDTAATLCARTDISPFQVIYLAADGMNKSDIGRALRLGRSLTEPADSGEPSRRVWLLDEVSAIKGWTEQVKYERDQTSFGDDTVVCTGSSWSDEDEDNAERDLGAGRAGEASEIRIRLLLPMRFRDILLATGASSDLPAIVEPWDMRSDAARKTAITLSYDVDNLDLRWQAYLESGGFPRAVAEYAGAGAVSKSFLKDLELWLHQDVDRDAAADSVPRLLAELAARSTSPLNARDAAETLGYAHRDTFITRINRLIRCFACLPCPQVDDSGTPAPGTQAKYYLTDPLLAWLGSHLRAGLRAPEHPHLSEGALATALAAASERYEPGRWLTKEAIGYVRTGGNKEVDFAPMPLRSDSGVHRTTPVESKWVDMGWRSEARVMEGRFPSDGILATKRITDFDNAAWAIPAPVLAILLG